VRRKLNASSVTERDLNRLLAARFEISFVEVSFGRAELEEYLVLRWRSTLYNKPAVRLKGSPQYRWVQPVVS